jgi:ISXO2-like transposase domain
VSGDVHTNTIEGFWSLVKNGIRGVYHSVSKKHLQGYLNEYARWYNNRAGNASRAQFELLLLRAASRS